MADYVIEFPDYFDEYAWEIEAKGYFADLTIVVGVRRLHPTFYDPVRLEQTYRDDLAADQYFAVGGLVVVPVVTRQHIEAAVERLSRGDFRDLLDALGEP